MLIPTINSTLIDNSYSPLESQSRAIAFGPRGQIHPKSQDTKAMLLPARRINPH